MTSSYAVVLDRTQTTKCLSQGDGGHVLGGDMKRCFSHNPQNVLADLVMSMTFHARLH